jgi:dimethylargininase
MLALAQTPSLRMDYGVRTYVAREAIDFTQVLAQHAGYCRTLANCGAAVRVLEINSHFADGVFIEDTAVVLDEVAILASMGTASRRGEPAGIEQVLREYREVVRIEPPAMLEGGDVLRVGKTLLVGLSTRTNAAGVSALADVARRYDYKIHSVAVRGCLHLKTGCTALPGGRLLVNPAWIELSGLRGYELIFVPDDEPAAGNVILLDAAVILAAAHQRTAGMIAKLGVTAHPVDISEFAKAEGGVTCLSILIP